jgi:hypothetical protein
VTCDDVRPKLTAYLDGELDGDRGSALRGHLRGCESCRALAADEAVLRDGLRALPVLDPPASLWAGVQRQLAAAEVADSERPAWRRVLSSFRARWAPLVPQLAIGSAALAVAVSVLAWRYHDRGAPQIDDPQGPIAQLHLPTPTPPVSPAPTLTIDGDVTAELAAEVTRTTATYQQAADELVQVALSSRSQWSDDRKQVFDTKLAALRRDVANAHDARPRNKAYRSMIRYLQGVAIRDEITANDRKLAGTRGMP